MKGRPLNISQNLKSTIFAFFKKWCYCRNMLREEYCSDKITAWYASNKQERHIYNFFFFAL
jgi:hypothetical protein